MQEILHRVATLKQLEKSEENTHAPFPFYRNPFYKNHEAQNHQKIKNILKIMLRFRVFNLIKI